MTIVLDNVSKSFRMPGTTRQIARDLTFRFPDDQAMALIGRNGAGKSSLLNMLAGTMRPDRGRVLRQGRISWPVGFQGSFHPDLTGLENARFAARLYGMDTTQVTNFIEDFAELGRQFYAPVRMYSAGMKSRLAFALSMSMPFDTYLIDEVTSVGDGAFREKSEALLQERLAAASAVVVSHSMELLSRLCTSGAVLENGRLFFYQRVERAIEHHGHLMRGQLPPWLA